jgi:hypothetical protein
MWRLTFVSARIVYVICEIIIKKKLIPDKVVGQSATYISRAVDIGQFLFPKPRVLRL